MDAIGFDELLDMACEIVGNTTPEFKGLVAHQHESAILTDYANRLEDESQQLEAEND